MAKSVAACYIPTGSGMTLRFITAMLPGLAAISAAVVASAAETPPAYFPARGAWERRSPAELGMDAARLQAAIDFAIANQNPRTRDLALDLAQTLRDGEPSFKLLGPTRPRGGMTGVIVRRGYVAAAWGEPDRVDMTFSVTKSFLTTVVGLAWQDGLIRNLNDRVRDYMPSPVFALS